jgi:crotonobetainyl-CoA:carnitine CoA-transferase CaiB-like acyl-CoA transferase
MLGEHNDEILRELGVGPEELERLARDQVIGDRPVV